jgi:hypothetical protein
VADDHVTDEAVDAYESFKAIAADETHEAEATEADDAKGHDDAKGQVVAEG